MYKVFWINFGYHSLETFAILDQAIEYGKSKGFEFRIDQDSKIIYSWSPITGGRRWTR